MLSGSALACLTMPSESRTLTSTCELALGNVSELSIRGVCEKALSCTVLFVNMYLFVWAGSSLQLVGSSSLTRDQTWAPALGAQSVSPWTTREVPQTAFYLYEFTLILDTL